MFVIPGLRNNNNGDNNNTNENSKTEQPIETTKIEDFKENTTPTQSTSDYNFEEEKRKAEIEEENIRIQQEREAEIKRKLEEERLKEEILKEEERQRQKALELEQIKQRVKSREMINKHISDLGWEDTETFVMRRTPKQENSNIDKIYNNTGTVGVDMNVPTTSNYTYKFAKNNSMSSIRSKKKGFLFWGIFLLFSFIIFRDLFGTFSQLSQTIFGMMENFNVSSTDIYKVATLSVGFLYGLCLFFPDMILKQLRPPIETFSYIVSDGFRKAEDLKKTNKEAANGLYLVLFFVLLNLVASVVVIHYIYVSSFNVDNGFMETISKIGVIYVSLLFLGFFTGRILVTYEDTRIDEGFRNRSMFFNSMFFILALIVSLGFTTLVGNTLHTKIENLNNEVKIFEN